MSYSPLKTLHGKLELSIKVNNTILSQPIGPCLPLVKGIGRRCGLVGVCNVKFGNRLISGGQSSPKLTPHIICQFPCVRKMNLYENLFCEGSSARLTRIHT